MNLSSYFFLFKNELLTLHDGKGNLKVNYMVSIHCDSLQTSIHSFFPHKNHEGVPQNVALSTQRATTHTQPQFTLKKRTNKITNADFREINKQSQKIPGI